ncbi:SpoIIE family protein phosphatase [Pelagicoccus sp. SDUM812003]|uniref:SpoIIE family protein phosphatase n=1 Tax=Pelagicoccus sp. SDUM812003 TaxID=3041267 RepID=UPI00280ED938|nr:SpoIIE family protein phosphatase [Pelagicoccus sp. SDUM812003]MDQ8202077.1 SpoIIE family protein phosphatase [Pelagicoccus sp. SDUM812003]
MPSPPETPERLTEIARTTLGLDPSAPKDRKVAVSGAALSAALEQAYRAGNYSHFDSSVKVDMELFFWQLMDSLPDNVYFKDKDSRFICVNRAQARFLGVDDPNDAIGKSDFDFFERDKALERYKDEQEIVRTGVGWNLHEERDLETDDAEKVCIISSKLPLRDASGAVIGTFGISRDISERYLAEREVERQKNLLETIIQILPCRVFVRNYENRFIMINEAYRKAIGVKDRKDVIGHRLSEFTRHELRDQIREEDRQVREDGKSILNQVQFDKSVFEKQRWVVTSKVPLRGPDLTIEGIVGMTYDITEQKEAEEQARALSERLSAKNEEFEAELLVARQLQETLMSMGFDANRQFTRSGERWKIDASYYYKPSHHLAGDFFDLIPISRNKLGVLVCDVMGHGVKASLVTMLLRGLVMELPKLLDRPGKVLSRLNNRLCALAEGPEFPRFTTAVYMTLDLDSGLARIANAGHPNPIWKTRDESGKSAFLSSPCGEIGPALGLIPNEVFTAREFSFEQLTEILFYTDGITEQKDAMGRDFGTEKLEDILLRNENLSLPKQLETVRSALRLTAGSKEFDDDICLVALRLSQIGGATRPVNGAQVD